MGQGKTQTRALNARQPAGIVNPVEGHEQVVELAFRHAHARITDHNGHPGAITILLSRQLDIDGAVLGVFHGVADQVDDDFLQLAPVGDYPFWNRAGLLTGQLQTLGTGPGTEDFHRAR